jgi:uncharacterized tellurite resistance protein B-like protein
MFKDLDEMLKEQAPLHLEREQRSLQVAVVAFLVEACMSNQQFRDEELQKAVDLTTTEFGLANGEAGHLLEIVRVLRVEEDKATKLLGLVRDRLSEDQRIRLLSMVWKIVLADGIVDQLESEFAAKFRKELGLSMEQAVLAQQLASTSS